MTTTETTDPDWLTVGAKAALITPARWGAPDGVKFVTVERLTKTRVVLSDGTWVSRDRLTTKSAGTNRTVYLYPHDADRVQRTVVEEQAATDRSRVIQAYNEWNYDRTGPDAAARLDALIAAAQAARATIDTQEDDRA